MKNDMPGLCPCCLGIPFADCCGPLLSGERRARQAEELMRSRYTAYARQDWSYLAATRYGGSGDVEYAPIHWVGLHILAVEEGGAEDLRGMVEFRALCLQGKMLGVLHERSRFVREGEQWYYTDGELFESEPIPLAGLGRNAPCPCGSGRKFKKCCLRRIP